MLFIHLLKNNHHEENDFIVDSAITEEGIKKALNCNLGYLSRMLKKHERDGLIYRKKLKVKNKKRKMTAFFLTDNGVELAKKICSYSKSKY